MSDLTRRQLVRRMAVIGAAPALARGLPGCVKSLAAPSRVVPVPVPVGGLIIHALADLPELQREGGSVVLVAQGHRTGDHARPAVLVAAARGGPPPRYLAFNAECTHEACFVSWRADDDEIECPCHGSRFASDGRVVFPPARVGLDVYLADTDGPNLRVQVYPGDGTFPAVADGAVTIAVADYPALQSVGGLVEGRATGYPDPIIVIRLASGFKALSGVCPHLGCTVMPQTSGFVCPCHQSQFSLSGTYVSGPADGADLFDLPLSEVAPGILRITPPG